MNCPFLSIIVPVRNEETHIAVLLEQLKNQDYPQDKFEILVVDGKSGDRTREVVQDFSIPYNFIRLLDNPKILSSAARNRGAQEAGGEIIIYIDGHCHIPNKELFKNIVSAFDKSGADCLGRAQPLVAGKKSITQAIAMARSSLLGHNPGSYIYSGYEGFVDPVSCGAVYKKELFQKVGYFDEGFDACEDVEFNLRVRESGLKCYLSPGLSVRYFPRESLAALFRQMFRYGWGRYKLIRKHPDSFSLLTFLPGLYLLVLLALLIAGLFNSLFFTLFLAGILCYAAPVLLFSIWLALTKGASQFPLLLLIFPTIHFAVSLGFWSSFIANFKKG